MLRSSIYEGKQDPQTLSDEVTADMNVSDRVKFEPKLRFDGDHHHRPCRQNHFLRCGVSLSYGICLISPPYCASLLGQPVRMW